MIEPRELGFGRLFDNVRDAVIVADAATGRITLWNRAATAIFGYTPEEARALSLGALLLERHRERYAAELARYRETGRGEYIDSEMVLSLPVLHRSGAELQVELTLSSFAAGGGERLVLAIIRDVTERRQAEEALRASAESFESLFNAATEGIAINAEGRHLAVNRALAAMVGYEPEELVGRSPLQLIAPESRDTVLRHMREGYERPYEAVALRRDGSTFPVEIAGKPIRYAGRQARLVTVRDITERKRLEEATLRASEDRFVKAFQASPVAMSISTLAEGRFVDVNESFLRLTGYRRDEVVGHTFHELHLPLDLERRGRLIELLRAGEAVRNVEGGLRAKTGEALATLVSMEIITVDGAECLLTITNDITERKRAEQALRESAESFESLFNATGEGMVITVDGRMQQVNLTFAAMLGREVEEITGRSPLEFAAPESRETVLANMTAGSERPYEAVYLRRDGTPVTLEIAGRPIRHGGRTVRLVSVRDVTERRRAEEARAELLRREQAARAEAEETARAREEFLSVASHELKTPLTTLKGSAQLLARQLNRAEPDREGVGRSLVRLQTQIDRLEALIADLLDASRLQQSELALRLEPVDLAALARQVSDRFLPGSEEGPAHALLLDTPSPVVGLWDADRLDQVLTNLVSNALKYSPQGGEVRVRVARAEEPGGESEQAEVVVSDQGIGIPAAEQATLFAPFVRGSAARQIAGGTGLGLYISARIVERHGGTIAVESAPGRGSTFTVRLPLRPPGARAGG